MFRMRCTLVVVEVISKTNAQFFKELKVGDMLEFSTVLRGQGRGNNGTYAQNVVIKNVHTGETVVKTFNRLNSILNNFVFEEV